MFHNRKWWVFVAVLLAVVVVLKVAHAGRIDHAVDAALAPRVLLQADDAATFVPSRIPYPVPPPIGSRLLVGLSGEGVNSALVVRVPSAGLNSELMAAGAFAAVWTAITASWTTAALRNGPLPIAAFSLPFWTVGALLVWTVLAQALEDAVLVVGPEQFFLQRGMLGWSAVVAGQTSALRLRTTTTTVVNGATLEGLEISEGVRTYGVAARLEQVELAFIIDRVEAYVRSIKTRYHAASQGPLAAQLPDQPGGYKLAADGQAQLAPPSAETAGAKQETLPN